MGGVEGKTTLPSGRLANLDYNSRFARYLEIYNSGPGRVYLLRSRPRARGQSPSGIRGLSRLYAVLVAASPVVCLLVSQLHAAGSGAGGHH